MSRHYISVFMLFNLLWAGALMAQDSTKVVTQSWTLQNCLDYAKQNNITLNSLRLTSKSSAQDLIQSKAAKTPNLTGSVSQSLTNYNYGALPSSGYGVSSSVTLYNGHYLTNDIKEKQLAIQVADLNLLSSENDITLQITQAYLNILLARENIVYLQDLVTTTQAEVTQGQQQYDAGTIALKDLMELKATLATDKYNLVNAENTKRQYILALKQILELPSGTAFDITKTDSVSDTIQVIPLKDALYTALQNRPEVKSSALSVEESIFEIEKAKAGLRPLLSLGGSVSTSYLKEPGYSYGYQLNSNFNQMLGLTLSIPILDRKVTQTNVAKAKIQTDQAKLTLQNTKMQLSQSVEQAYLNVVNAQSQLSAAQEQLLYSKEAYRIANEQLKIGTYNIVDFLQQKNIYIQAQQSYIQAKYATALYDKVYNFYTGIPVTL